MSMLEYRYKGWLKDLLIGNIVGFVYIKWIDSENDRLASTMKL